MADIMEIFELNGDDGKLHRLVAHLTIDEKVLAYNRNYPFKASDAYRWFVATLNGVTVGFMPVKLGRHKAVINNYYIEDDKSGIFDALLQTAVGSLGKTFEIESVTQTVHINHFNRNGFYITTFWKNYVRMRASKHAKERV